MIKNLFIIANTRCNLRCNYCYYNDTERSNNNYLDIDKLGNFIDEKIERVSITGGEPLLNPFIRAYLDVLKDKAKKIILSTNGTLVSDEAIKILKEYNINKVFVSLDSIDNELHDKQRDGTKAQVLSSIRKLLNNNINIQISSVVTAENIENMFKLEQFCIDKKMKFWPQPIFTKDILLDLKSISEKRWGKLLNLNNNTPRMKKFIINYYNFFIKTNSNPQCKCPFGSSLVVEVNGNIKRCFYSAHFANINNTKLSQIIFNEQVGDCFGDQCFQYIL